jgi:hypothetical protein
MLFIHKNHINITGFHLENIIMLRNLEAACGFITEAEAACFLRKQVDLQGACFERELARRIVDDPSDEKYTGFWLDLCGGNLNLGRVVHDAPDRPRLIWARA